VERTKVETAKSIKDTRKTTRERLEKENAELKEKLSEALASEKREREEKEQIQKDKLLGQKQMAKQLEEAAERETKERLAREKLEIEKQEQAKEKLARDKMAEGPEIPDSIPQPVYCSVPDEAQLGLDIYIHCVPQGSLKATVLALYYRASGSTHYNSLAMDKSRKGWFTAVIPGDKVAGKVMQYYVQAQDKEGEPVDSNGKSASPNVILLKKKVTRVADVSAGTLTNTSAASDQGR
jgi:hypothetical protein